MLRVRAYQPVVAFAPIAEHVSIDEAADLTVSDGWEHARATGDL
ncbi:MAG: hypothetical protein ABSB59_24460 [Streptosporangiaceae bacterium]